MSFRLMLAALLSAVLTFSLNLTAAQQYVAVDLAPDGGFSFAHAVNNHGQVVGRTLNRAFLWENGVMRDLGTLPGGSYSEAFSINDSGQVVGWSTIDDATCTLYDGCWHAFLWQDGVMTDLGGLDSRFQSYAYSINDRGQIAGISATGDYPTGTWRAIVWDHGTVVDLGGVPDATNTYAYGINARGDVVGSWDGSQPARPRIWSNGSSSALPPAGSGSTEAYKINNQGVVVGAGDVSGRQHAVVWVNGAIADLGTLPGATWSFGRDINERGQVVGESFFAAPGRTRGFVWQGGTMIDLGTLPGGANSYAQGINDAGVIAGASDNGGLLHAVIWVKR
jgi:probable HAF family extracellular repeat protein